MVASSDEDRTLIEHPDHEGDISRSMSTEILGLHSQAPFQIPEPRQVTAAEVLESARLIQTAGDGVLYPTSNAADLEGVAEHLLRLMLPGPWQGTVRRRACRTPATLVLPGQPVARPRSRITVELPEELVEECRDAVVFLSGPPDRLTMAGLVRDALRRELDRLRQERNGGEGFPARDSDPRCGRPVR